MSAATTAGISFDTIISVYGNNACSSNRQCIAANDDVGNDDVGSGSIFSSRVTWNFSATGMVWRTTEGRPWFYRSWNDVTRGELRDRGPESGVFLLKLPTFANTSLTFANICQQSLTFANICQQSLTFANTSLTFANIFANICQQTLKSLGGDLPFQKNSTRLYCCLPEHESKASAPKKIQTGICRHTQQSQTR